MHHLHDPPRTPAEAEQIQDRLRPLLVLTEPGPQRPRTIAGLDVTYAGDRLAAAVVVIDAATLEVLEKALTRLSITPDLLVCDGHGLAHPRRFGLACHLGVLTGLPSMGVAKNHLVGMYDPPASERGASSPLVDHGEVIGRVLRTQR